MIDASANLKRNFRLAVINGIIFQASFPFIDGTLILPMFLSHLTDSRSVIGFAGALGAAGWAIPQVFAAYYATRAASRIRFYLKAGIFRVGALVMLVSVASFQPAPAYRSLMLAGILTCLAVLYISSGFSSIAFLEVIRTSTPADHRGRLWGYRRFWGGLCVVAMTPMINRVLDRMPFPQNYRILFFIAFLLTLTGIIVFGRVREHSVGNTAGERGPLRYYRETFRQVVKERGYRLLLLTHAIAAFWYMTLPFYILFFKTQGGMDDAQGALYLAFMTVGRLSSNAVWAWINDRYGSRVIYRWISLPALISALMMVLAPPGGHYGIRFSIPAFFFMGCATCGFEIGFTNVTLDLADRGGKAGAIGLMNTLGSIFFVSPILGGVLIDLAGFKPVFTISFIAALCTLPPGIRLAGKRYGNSGYSGFSCDLPESETERSPAP